MHSITSSYRHRLHSTIALNLLNCFIKHLYLDDNSQKIISIGDIYEMIWSHSQFLDIILSPIETDNLVKGMKYFKCVANLLMFTVFLKVLSI